MVILSHFAPQVKVYERVQGDLTGSGGVVELARVHTCPGCRTGDCIKWGTYRRWTAWLTTAVQIRVQRYRCKACGRTHGSLPSFCAPGFTYSVPLMGHTLERYFGDGLSCERIVQEIRGRWSGHTLVVASVRRWVTGFRVSAEERLTAVNTALAEQSPGASVVVDRPVGGTPGRRKGAALLVALEALRRASEGLSLGRGFHQRRFEFYHFWLFRHCQGGLMG